MKKYYITFIGRLAGSIGIPYPCQDIIYGEENFSKDDIILCLYEGRTESTKIYDNIHLETVKINGANF